MQLLALLTTKSLFISSSLRDKYFIRTTDKTMHSNVSTCSMQWAHVSLLISTYYLNINQHLSLYLLDASSSYS